MKEKEVNQLERSLISENKQILREEKRMSVLQTELDR